MANALVSNHLDYCKSLFRSLSSFNMCKLQCIQNILGRSVTNCNRYSRATPILKKFHWLPFRCIFKTASLVYKFLHSGNQSYFNPLLSICCGTYDTRYNCPDKRFLNDVRSVPNLACFRKKLKSYLFDKTFPPCKLSLVLLVSS